jgi:hypothetical protein
MARHYSGIYWHVIVYRERRYYFKVVFRDRWLLLFA